MYPRHPLDLLSKDEITNAVTILKTEKSLEAHHLFAYLQLDEPTRADLRDYDNGKVIDRIAFACILDSKKNETFEAKVNLTTGAIDSWTKLPFDKPPYGQAPILPSEVLKCERIVKADEGWRAAMKKRGLSDNEIDMLQIDAFSAGFFDREDENGKRLVRGIAYYRERLTDNGYARPVEGVVAVVDLTKEEVMRLDDDGKLTPIPKEKNNYDRESVPVTRPAPKPLDIIQPEGPGFVVDGYQVSWENWKFRVGFNQREGLVLHTITYDDEGNERSIMHRASISEMVVPYADPSMSQNFKAAFDSGENGFGRCARCLELGCDCVGNIYYFDLPSADDKGNPITQKHVVCMHEEDKGILFSHDEIRSGISETRRARELIISFSTRIDNYDYVIYWHLTQAGEIRCEIKLTGIVQTAAIYPRTKYEWGGLLTPELAAPTHQHLFSARLDMAVDGPDNAVVESEYGKLPVSEINPDGIAFGYNKTIFQYEQDAVRIANAATQRTWTVFNPNFLNANGQPTAYQIYFPQTPLLLADESSTIYKRAGFATKSFWVTQDDPTQKFASGDYPNQHAGGDGLPRFIEKNRPIFNKQIVVWPTFGTTHMPRPEDLPIMPAETVMFKLKPFGFFNENPAIGLPPGKNKRSVKQVEEKACCCEPENIQHDDQPIRFGLRQ